MKIKDILGLILLLLAVGYAISSISAMFQPTPITNKTFNSSDMTFTYPSDLKLNPDYDPKLGASFNTTSNNDTVDVSPYGPIEGENTWDDLVDSITHNPSVIPVKNYTVVGTNTTYEMFVMYTDDEGDEGSMGIYAVNNGGKCFLVNDYKNYCPDEVKIIIATIH